MGQPMIVVYEDENTAVVDIVRTGLDLSKPATVWCTTSMVSDGIHKAATPGIDYVPISQKISFTPGQQSAVS